MLYKFGNTKSRMLHVRRQVLLKRSFKRLPRVSFSSDSPVTAVRDNHRFDEKLLCQFLTSKGLIGFKDNNMTVKQFSHGQSNPSFMIEDEHGRKYTVRKQPPGKLLPGAHAVDREYTVMSALNKSNVAVPSTRLYCEDSSVLGAPFFVYGASCYFYMTFL